jgi:hypothetical protein
VILERWLVQEDREKSPKGNLRNSGEYYMAILGTPVRIGQVTRLSRRCTKGCETGIESTRSTESDEYDFDEGMWEEEVVE